jgi:putative ABC transport system permease protein
MPDDLEMALRSTRSAPGASAVAVVALALGIGVCVTVFSVFDALCLRPLGFDRPAEMVRVEIPRFSYSQYLEMRDEMPSLRGLVAVDHRGAMLRNSEGAVPLLADVVSPNYFAVLGVRPAMGRLFTLADEREAHEVVVISDRLWRERFGSDPGLVGRTIRLSERPVTVVGVAPRGFTGTDRTVSRDLWYPAWSWGSSRDSSYRGWSVLGRLRPGASLSAAQVETETHVRRLAILDEATRRPSRVLVRSEAQAMLDGGGRLSLMLLPLVLLVLLVACVDVSAVLLARAEERRRDTTLRLVLGSPRGALIRLLLAESLVLATLGGALGLFLAHWGLAGVRALIPLAVRTSLPELRLDTRALAVALGLTLLATVAAGLRPALYASRANLVALLSGASPSGRVRGGRALPRFLIVSQVACASLLLSVASLFLNGLRRGLNVDLGFSRRQVLAVSAVPGMVGVSGSMARAYYDELSSRLAGLPGVRQTALAFRAPLSLSGGGYARKVFLAPDRGEAGWQVKATMVSATYFDTLGIPIVLGRAFTEDEARQGRRVVVVSEAMARRFWPDENPVGRWLWVDSPQTDPHRVVGVACDVRINTIDERGEALAYYPFGARSGDMVVLVGSSGPDAGALAPLVRKTMREVNPEVAPLEMTTLDELIHVALLPQRAAVSLLGALGIVAAILALSGLAGMVAQGVSRRTHEIGIRAALGAREVDSVRLVLGEGLFAALCGGALGIALAIAAWQLVRNLLYGTSATDGLVLVGAGLVVVCVAALAAYVPARRAARIDPMMALRHE